jgi:integrase
MRGRNNYDLALSGVRDRLSRKPRHEPYWQNMGAGRKLGLRFSASGSAAWVAKWTSKRKLESGSRPRMVQSSLGQLDSVTHAEAWDAANQWFREQQGGINRAGTVADACGKYVEKLRRDKGERSGKYAKYYFAKHVTGSSIGAMKLADLTAEDLRNWLDALVTPKRKKNSANRILRTLKAALNFAFEEKLCASDAEWRRVKPLKGAGARDGERTAYLTAQQRRRLIENADSDTADFIRALLHSAARPNEMQAARVSDFDARERSLRLVSLKGRGEERVRYVPLSGAAVEFLKGLSKGKTPAGHLVTCQRLPWARHLWADGIRAALQATNEEIDEPKDRLPQDVVAYTMRHCAITDMLRAGVDVSSVAKIAGTSIAMINSHYAKFVQADVRDKLANIVAF